MNTEKIPSLAESIQKQLTSTWKKYVQEIKTIPLSQIPAQTFTVVLDNQYCTISLYYRGRLYADVYVNETAICKGALCQNGADIVQSRSSQFKGQLMFIDMEGDKAPQWEQLHTGRNGRWVLLYLHEEIVKFRKSEDVFSFLHEVAYF